MPITFHLPLSTILIVLLLSACTPDFYFPESEQFGFIVGEYPEKDWIISEYHSETFDTSSITYQPVDVTGDSVADLFLSIASYPAGSRVPPKVIARISAANDSIDLNARYLEQKEYHCACGDFETGRNMQVFTYTDPDFLKCWDTCSFSIYRYVQEFCRCFQAGDTVFAASQWADYRYMIIGSSQSGQTIVPDFRQTYQINIGEWIWEAPQTLAFRIRNGDRIRYGTLTFSARLADPLSITVHETRLTRYWLDRTSLIRKD
jgi:hypothetical protein